MIYGANSEGRKTHYLYHNALYLNDNFISLANIKEHHPLIYKQLNNEINNIVVDIKTILKEDIKNEFYIQENLRLKNKEVEIENVKSFGNY